MIPTLIHKLRGSHRTAKLCESSLALYTTATALTNLHEYQPVVGIEVHAQINSKSKLFSSSNSNFFAPLNSVASFFDCALPGTLPALNRKCVEAAVATSLALNCEVNFDSRFDRKHYFYADLPAGYQITQYSEPISRNGRLDFYVSDATRRFGTEPYKKHTKIFQVQLEQDSGKTYADLKNDRSLIDLNRAGCALMEIVFEHNLTSGLEAACLLRELARILKCLGTCGCNMEMGQLRVDANISVHKKGHPLGTKTEVKNLNSFRFVHKAIDYEIQRQMDSLERGIEVANETMMFDFRTCTTAPMRDKEGRQDYRYMPEPNLPPLRLYSKSRPAPSHVDPVSIVNVDDIKDNLPQLPGVRRQAYVEQYNVPLDTILRLEEDQDKADFFHQCCEHSKEPAYLALQLSQLDFSDLKVSAATFAHLCSFMSSSDITKTAFDKILSDYKSGLISTNVSAQEAIDQANLWQIKDDAILEDACEKILASSKKKPNLRNIKRLARSVSNSLNNKASPEQLEKIIFDKLSCRKDK